MQTSIYVAGIHYTSQARLQTVCTQAEFKPFKKENRLVSSFFAPWAHFEKEEGRKNFWPEKKNGWIITILNTLSCRAEKRGRALISSEKPSSIQQQQQQDKLLTLSNTE